MAAGIMAADFGPLVIETDVDAAVVRTLRLWLPTELAAFERERGLALRLLRRPEPQSYTNTFEEDDFPDTRLPSIIVTTAQMEGDPEMDGDGVYYGAWRVVVTAIVRGKTQGEARAIAAMFGGCVRRTMVHQLDLGGFAGDIRLRGGGRVAPVSDSTGQDGYLAASINPFTVYVDAIVQAGGGPYLQEPDDPNPYDPPDPAGDPDAPYDPLVPVTTVTTTVTAKPIEEE